MGTASVLVKKLLTTQFEWDYGKSLNPLLGTNSEEYGSSLNLLSNTIKTLSFFPLQIVFFTNQVSFKPHLSSETCATLLFTILKTDVV